MKFQKNHFKNYALTNVCKKNQVSTMNASVKQEKTEKYKKIIRNSQEADETWRTLGDTVGFDCVVIILIWVIFAVFPPNDNFSVPPLLTDWICLKTSILL